MTIGIVQERVAFADIALRAFEQVVEPGELEADPGTVLVDLLCNLQHWADAREINWVGALRWATFHHLAETGSGDWADLDGTPDSASVDRELAALAKAIVGGDWSFL